MFNIFFKFYLKDVYGKIQMIKNIFLKIVHIIKVKYF